MLQPERKSLLAKYTKAVQHIVYDAGRMKELAPMLNTRDGAVKAVMAVLGVIDQRKPIPQDIKTLLAINTYIIMVDLLKDVYQKNPERDAVGKTIMAIIKAVAAPKQPQPAQAMPQMGGLINNMGA